MTKLSDITGYAENWPKKFEICENRWHVDYGIIYPKTCPVCLSIEKKHDIDLKRKFNSTVDQTSSLGIGIDEEMLAKLWFENYFDDQWEDCSGIERALILQVAKALARQSHKFLRIEKE